MLLALACALAVAKPTVVTRGELPVGPVLGWTVSAGAEHSTMVRGIYETDARAVTLARSKIPLLVVGRDGRDGVLVAETGDQFTVWRVDAKSGAVDSWTGDTPAAPAEEQREPCGERWPPRVAGSWSITLDPDVADAKTILRVKAFAHRAYVPKTYAEDGGRVMHKVAGLVAQLSDTEQLVAFSGQDEILWRLTEDGVARRAAVLGDNDVALVSAVAVSPDGSMYAVGATPRDQWETRRLLVFDAQSGDRLLEVPDISVATTSSTELPVLEMLWMGNDKVRYSESIDGGARWVEVAVPSGEQTWSRVYSESLGKAHRTPPGAECLGVVVSEGQVRVVETGSLVLAGNFGIDVCAWSADGQAAACVEGDKLWLVDGLRGNTKPIAQGDVKGVRWLD